MPTLKALQGKISLRRFCFESCWEGVCCAAGHVHWFARSSIWCLCTLNVGWIRSWVRRKVTGRRVQTGEDPFTASYLSGSRASTICFECRAWRHWPLALWQQPHRSVFLCHSNNNHPQRPSSYSLDGKAHWSHCVCSNLNMYLLCVIYIYNVLYKSLHFLNIWPKAATFAQQLVHNTLNKVFCSGVQQSRRVVPNVSRVSWKQRGCRAVWDVGDKYFFFFNFQADKL